jgi:phosphoribosylformimino-5-aminoimidazole carboxamide ribotide isomerase
MIAVPAVDVREGACVQLVGGAYDAERVRLADPPAVARRWVECGFTRLHAVDLDAATGRGGNAAVLRAIVAGAPVPVSVGGGVRDDATLAAWLAAGADTVVAGTRAVEDRTWLEAAAARAPGRIVVAADVRGRTVVTRGWAGGGGPDVIAFAAALAGLPLAGLLVTAVHREGLLQGPDVALVREAVAATALPVIASGGIAAMRDLERLREAGAAQAVLGMALYTGALDGRAVAREFSA